MFINFPTRIQGTAKALFVWEFDVLKQQILLRRCS